MHRILAVCTGLLLTLAVVTSALAASAPTNGGSHNGGGQSGTCTGALADRPADCGPH